MRQKELPTYVSPYAPGEAPAPIVRYEPMLPAEVLPPASVAHVELRTTYTDRAVGFQLATLPISVAFGVGALIVAIAGYAVPVVSVAALAVFWLAFLAWWLLGWAIHHIVSPDGVSLIHALLGWRYLQREQAERFKRYRQ